MIHENREQFLEVLQIAESAYGISDNTIEKDYYVTMFLKRLSEKEPCIVFKGGTSLSKCHKAVKRFSEDIDIAISRNLSQSEKRHLKSSIVETAEELGLTITNLENIRSRRDYNRYEIAYASVLPDAKLSLTPIIMLETSFTEVSFPTLTMDVHCYIGDVINVTSQEISAQHELLPFKMEVQSLERTLADKLFAIGDYYLKGASQRYSRHIYDVYKLLQFVPLDDNFKSLLADVRAVRERKEVCLSAQSSVDMQTLLKEIIDTRFYEKDYKQITVHILEEGVPYEEAISGLQRVVDSGLFIKNQDWGDTDAFSEGHGDIEKD